MEKYVASCEIIYIGCLRVKANNTSEAMEQAFNKLDEMRMGKDFPESVGDSEICFADIRIDNVEYNVQGEYIANVNLQYVGDFHVYAEDGSDAWDQGQKLLDEDDVPDKFGIFEKDFMSIYDACPYEW